MRKHQGNGFLQSAHRASVAAGAAAQELLPPLKEHRELKDWRPTAASLSHFIQMSILPTVVLPLSANLCYSGFPEQLQKFVLNEKT